MIRSERRHDPHRGWRRPSILVLAICLVASMGFTSSNASSRAQGPPPSGNLDMEGDFGTTQPIDDPTHDPAIIKDPRDQTYYVFSTGILRDQNPEEGEPTGPPGGIFMRSSEGSLAGPWVSGGELPVPEWTLDYEHNHLWAPQVVRTGNTFWLYYATSQVGTQNSAIGVMSTTTPGDLESWEDHGPVLTSQVGDPYNAIDPHVFKDHGRWYLTFGSWWDGIFLFEMDSMTSVSGDPVHLAERTGAPSIEAPTIIKRQGYYYLFTSRGYIVNPTYSVQVGRSKSLTGPYVDKDGVPMLDGGGTVILDGGAGGQDVIKEFGRYYMVHHHYEGEFIVTDDPFGFYPDLQIRMQIRELQWSDDGWPYFLDD